MDMRLTQILWQTGPGRLRRLPDLVPPEAESLDQNSSCGRTRLDQARRDRERGFATTLCEDHLPSLICPHPAKNLRPGGLAQNRYPTSNAIVGIAFIASPV